MSFSTVSKSKVKSENYTYCSLHAAVLCIIFYSISEIAWKQYTLHFPQLQYYQNDFSKNYGNENGRCASKVTTNLSIRLSAF